MSQLFELQLQFHVGKDPQSDPKVAKKSEVQKVFDFIFKIFKNLQIRTLKQSQQRLNILSSRRFERTCKLSFKNASILPQNVENPNLSSCVQFL